MRRVLARVVLMWAVLAPLLAGCAAAGPAMPAPSGITSQAGGSEAYLRQLGYDSRAGVFAPVRVE